MARFSTNAASCGAPHHHHASRSDTPKADQKKLALIDRYEGRSITMHRRKKRASLTLRQKLLIKFK
jgi:hypothetical protein